MAGDMTNSFASTTERFPFQLLLAILALGLILAGCAGQGGRQTKLYQMGEPAEAGSLVYTVLESEWHSHLAEARMPQHSFLLLRVSVTNSGGSDVLVPPMQITAPGGAQYPELTSGEGVPEWLGTLRKLRPAETVHGRVLFDLPRGDYQLRVADDVPDPDQMSVAVIDVPLRYESQTGPLPAPAQAP